MLGGLIGVDAMLDGTHKLRLLWGLHFPVSVPKAAAGRQRRLLASRRRDDQPLSQQDTHGLMRGTDLRFRQNQHLVTCPRDSCQALFLSLGRRGHRKPHRNLPLIHRRQNAVFVYSSLPGA